jgi:hypothetical protein
MMPLDAVLELARWAPSGDNTQPWRFALRGSDALTVFGHDTRAHCVYDLDGHPSQISIGALLETIALAATRFGLATQIVRREAAPDERPVFDLRFSSQPGRTEDPLVAHISARTVHRRPLRVRRLFPSEKSALERAAGRNFSLVWFEGWRMRARVAWLNFTAAKIRLTMPEAYRVHRDVIEWGARSSVDRVPDAALGASVPTLMLMRWAMASWKRIVMLNRFFGGTLAPRLELDLLPGIACAAHCVLVAAHVPATVDDYIAAGRALQRFWLTATSLGLQFQPEYTPLIFARYSRQGRNFTAVAPAIERAQSTRKALERLLGVDVAERAVFMGRIGAGHPAQARSLRLPLERLLAHGDQKL